MDDNTQHALDTEHGYDTFHKFPDIGVSEVDILQSLSTQLYPTGKAFVKAEDGVFRKLHKALNISFVRIYEDINLFVDSVFPDNDNFTEEDADLWEYRLGLISSKGVDLESRKQSIKRKMGFPNGIQPRQHVNFIESQLRSAGFDVYIHENTKPYKNPSDVSNISFQSVQHGGGTQHGNGVSHGSDNFSVIANSLNEVEQYSIGGDENLWATFFIGGEDLGDYATIEAERLKEFRETVIKLKPAHTVAFLFVNFV